jgi:hypothetical protein
LLLSKALNEFVSDLNIHFTHDINHGLNEHLDLLGFLELLKKIGLKFQLISDLDHSL